MAKTPYTVDVDEYVCTELEYIRKMHETRDYSGLMATVERIQYHANRMEGAISAAFDKKWEIDEMCSDESISDIDFRTKVKDLVYES